MLSPPAIKYHDFENQRSTCYVNSVLQVLFMTKDSREAAGRFPSENTEHIDHLQSLFGDFKSRTAKTKDITKKLGIQDVYRRQKAAKYYEKILRLTSDDASKISHRQLTHMTTCSSCDTKTGADRDFWHLPLALEASSSQNYSVEKGIEEFFRASHFNGENQMYCDECRAWSDATTKCVIKHHPEVLTLLLKRFQLDHNNNSYVKINCTVDVPCTLQIPENQPYELYAMVEHFGDLRGGHYIATIKSEHDGRWHSFNDSCVTLLHSQPFQSDKVKKSSSASLLFYRKEKVPAAGTQDFREESTPGGFPLSTGETQDQSPAERREEDEGTAEEGKYPAATAFIDRDKGTGIKDKDRGKSRKSGLSPDISNVESKKEDMRGNAGIRTSRHTSPVETVSNMRSPPAIKYHGLVNQGSTCYLNSVLQVLFMTKDFREALERFPSEKTEHIDLQLQSLFGDLKRCSAKTKDITKKLGIQYVYRQQDAAEYYEKILRLTSDDASKIFHGQLTHMTTCSSCDTKTGADGALWHLPLALEASSSQNYSVEKGIEEFFRASHFNGENQMYCDECRAKSDATTKCVIKHHPEVLMLLLKRFDYYSNRYVKNNCTVDVPCTLKIPENQTYELYAMVEHFGDLRGGHYIATIKSEDDGRLYRFNDSCVTEIQQRLSSVLQKRESACCWMLYPGPESS